MRSMLRRPDFLMIGSMKSGTTSLWDDLCLHPKIFSSPEKEPNILIKYKETSQIHKEYDLLFSKAQPGQLCGEASTWYTKRPHFENVAKTAFDSLGSDLKLIMIMRDPILRLHSHLRHHLVMGMIKPEECDKAIFEDPRYTAFSDYAMQLEPWIEQFGLDKLYALSLREFRQQRQYHVRQLLAFLDVPDAENAQVHQTVSNAGDQLRSNKKSVWRQFSRSRFYQRYIKQLLPDGLREGARDWLLPVRKVPTYTLKPETDTFIRDRLKAVEGKVQALIGRPVQIVEKPELYG